MSDVYEVQNFSIETDQIRQSCCAYHTHGTCFSKKHMTMKNETLTINYNVPSLFLYKYAYILPNGQQ